MTELERALAELGAEIEFPPAPSMAARVSARLAAGERPRRRRRLGRTLVLAFAVFLVAVGAAFAVPASRNAILEWFGLQGATVEIVESIPAVSLPSQTSPPETSLLPGPRLSLADAERRVGFPVAVPAVIGVPDEIHVQGAGNKALVTLVYAPDNRLAETSLPGVGLLLTEFRGDLAPEAVGKLATPATVVEEVTVGDEPGIWLEGEPHEVFYRDENGDIIWDTLRLAGNTLLWERGNLLLRLEADVPKSEALRIARSVRG